MASQDDLGFAAPGTFGTQILSTDPTSPGRAEHSSSASSSTLGAGDVEDLKQGMNSLQQSVAQLVKTIPMHHLALDLSTDAGVSSFGPLNDQELVSELQALLPPEPPKIVARDADLSVTESESDEDDPKPKPNLGFLMAPPKRRDADWHSRRLDIYFAVHDELSAVRHHEVSLDRHLVRMQVQQEKLRLEIAGYRADLQRDRQRRERLARAAMELNKRLRHTEFNKL
ncbi:hypothetical protein D9758_007949 [Tetrapyrgos nigripes]|uniref:Uncharacterized protein n=1 Tax=Tetrapyrgos nigripes TaxID=182062 RepID=A0A8H5D631_9AGAR|nr:hypothetical protein D9758_007949 [Tetrapyrgos nigripes]